MPYFVRSKTNDNFLYFLIFVFVLACYILGHLESGAGVLILVTLTFLIFSNYKFEVYPFHIFVFLFGMYCYASSLWALNYHTALSKGNTIMQILVCLSVMYCHLKKMNDVTRLMQILMWGGYVVVFYAYFFYGVERVVDINSEEGRLSNSFNNINTLAMLAATVVLINLFFIMYRNSSKWHLLLIIPMLVFVISSQSRKSVAMVVLGYLFLAFLKYMRGRLSNFMPIIRILGVILVVGIVMYALSSTSLMDRFFNRMMGAVNSFTGEGELDASTQARVALRESGWAHFLENPWFGVGMGCSYYATVADFGEKTYFHDNYIEILVCGGIIGLIVYYAMFVYVLAKEIKYFKKDNMAILVIVLIVIKLLTDYGAVTYYSKISYFQLMVYYLHLQSCKLKYPDVK